MSDLTKSVLGRKQRVLGLLNKWLVWRLAGLAFWYWLIALRGQALDLPALQYIGLLGLLPVLRHLFHRKWWVGLLAIVVVPFHYFVVLPIVGVYWIIRLARIALATPVRAVQVATSAWGFLISVAAFVAFLVLIPMTRNQTALLALGFLNLFVSNVLFLCGLAWASNPLAPLIGMFTRIWKVFEWFVSTLLETSLRNPAQSGIQIAQSTAEWLKKHVVDESGHLRNASQLLGSSGRFFAGAVLVLFAVLVSGYAVTYLALQRSGLSMLQGLEAWPSLGTTWYYSLTISATALHGGAVPTSSWGRLVQSLQLFNTAMFLTLTLFLLSYAMGSRGKRDVRRLRSHPQILMRKLEEFIATQRASEALSLPSGTERDPVQPESTDT